VTSTESWPEVVEAATVYAGAIEVGDRLWLSSTKSDRTGVFDRK